MTKLRLSDMNIIAYLHLHGLEPVKVQHEEGRIYYVYEGEDVTRIKNKYYEEDTVVHPMIFANALKAIKHKIHDDRKKYQTENDFIF